jgi:transposase, IS30 family
MQKKYTHLNQGQRHQISALYKAGHSLSFIADHVGINRSTVSRELKRNAKKFGSYNAICAQEMANERKERFSLHRKFTPTMEKFIREKLSQEQWSPEQIKGYCDKNHIPMISHERIYQFIYQDQADGGILYSNLRTARKKYRRRYGSGKYAYQSIKNRIFIDQRPDVINSRQRYGDWEIDTIVGKNNKGSIVTLVERKSAFTLMAKLSRKNADELARTVINLMAPYKEKVLSITSDNGSEFARHQMIAKKLQADFYFAHPYSAWERGLNENTNRLIRQYIPKKVSFDIIDQGFVNQVSLKLNKRPRKKLHYNSPLWIYLTNFKNTVALSG